MLRALIALPFLVVLVLFALSNAQEVTIGLWPTDVGVTMHLSIAILVAMGIAFFLGALLVWIPALKYRRRARRAEKTVQRLEQQLDELKRTPPAPPGAVTAR
jgi:lipopolysaccharide assembly protein A